MNRLLRRWNSRRSNSDSGTIDSTIEPAPEDAHNNFTFFRDRFATLDHVAQALKDQGLESSNLILGIDFTKSNEWSGKNSFWGLSLHNLGELPNPYEEAIKVVARTLHSFDEDHLIPCYGFGDATTHDDQIFSFYPGDRPAQGLEDVQNRYRQLVPHVKLAGPTSFAPLINHAMRVVVQNAMQYHILVIVADGQVTRGVDQEPGTYSAQEEATREAIAVASLLPLSIVMVGVGDGPWEMMREFDDQLPARQFDNFQFVNHTELMSQYGHLSDQQREAAFAVAALQEIPDQYRAIQRLKLLRAPPPPQINLGTVPQPLDPPVSAYAASMTAPSAPSSNGHMYPAVHHGGYQGTYSAAPQYGAPFANGMYGAGQQEGMYGASQQGAGQQYNQQQPPHYSQYPATSQQQPSPQQQPPGGCGSAAPDAMFVCPITTEIMEDPVVCADGFTYEKSAIADWLATHDTSPMTNAVLEHKHLTNNNVLRSAIREYQNR
jgi:E3 ubiquitin-protein ligase RGLG